MIGIASVIPRPTGGPVILRTLADYQCYTLTAVCSDCQRYTPLDHATLADRFGGWFDRSDRFIAIWDYNGYPTLSLPCGFSPDGIPLSLQLVGARLSESLLCRAGHAFEQTQEFHLQHPALT